MSPRCQPVVFDGWRSISISLYMTLVGVPVISTAWVELLGFTPEQVGRVAGAGMGYNKVFAMCATAAMVGLVIYGAMYLWLRRTIPALARAT